jgi:hypothetical protein
VREHPQREFPFRRSLNENFPVDQIEVFATALQFVGRQFEGLLAKLPGRLGDGVARRDHYPAGEGSRAVRDSRAVAGHDVNIFKVDTEVVGADLTERGLLSLTLGRRAGEDVNFSVGADLDDAAFVRTEAGAFDVSRDADAKANAALALL